MFEINRRLFHRLTLISQFVLDVSIYFLIPGNFLLSIQNKKRIFYSVFLEIIGIKKKKKTLRPN